MNQEPLKRQVGGAAATLIENGMTVGLGSGSTVYHFLEALGKRCREGITIRGLATSQATASWAVQFGVPLLADDGVVELDIAIDGADEIDAGRHLIKGGGGCLLREKIVIAMAHRVIIIADSTKLSPSLQRAPLPVEVIGFCCRAVQAHIEKLGLSVSRRMQENTPFVTENGHAIFDLRGELGKLNLDTLDRQLHSIPGVLETGLFLADNYEILIAQPNGLVDFL